MAHPPLVAVDHAERVGRHQGHFVVGQIDDLVGLAHQRRGVAGNVVAPGADADDQRAAQPGGHKNVRVCAKQHRQAVGALKLGQRPLDGANQRLVVGCRHVLPCRDLAEATVDEVGDHFRVGLGAEFVSLGNQAVFEHLEVLDHTVVGDRHGAVAAKMRMGILVGGRSVGSPAGVADADLAG